MYKQDLILRIKEIQKNQEKIVKKRVIEFNLVNSSDNNEWFRELIFCILAANTSSKMASRVVSSIDVDDFLKLDLLSLKEKLKEVSCRFFNKRAEYIFDARSYSNIKDILNKIPNNFEKRDWLVENIKGIGMKEASHFLRNTGHYDLAILDKHVRNVLFEYGIISENLRFKALTKLNYLEIEEILRNIADDLNLSQGELDFYVWFMKTGEVLK